MWPPGPPALILPTVLALTACSPGGRSDLPIPPGCGHEIAESPSCPSGTGLMTIGPEIAESSRISRVRGAGTDVFILVKDWDPAQNSIWRVPVNGDSPVRIMTESDCMPHRLAVDEVFVYWSGYGCVRRASRAGGAPQALMNVDGGSVFGVISHGASVFIIGAELGQVEHDGSVTILGHNEEIVDAVTDGRAIYGITDQSEPAIAVFDVLRREWWRIEPDHEERADPVPGIAAPGIAVDGDNIYWMANIQRSVARMPKHGGDIDKITTRMFDGEGIVAADGYVYWAAATQISRATCDGSYRMKLVQQIPGGMGDIALAGDHVYFTTGVNGDRLMRVCR